MKILFSYICVLLLISLSADCIGSETSDSYGADVPFTTYEAEAPGNTTTGKIVHLSSPPESLDSSPELEASGRAYVELTDIGQYLEFPYVIAANTVVIRHCIPDSLTGGGIRATLALYVNGVYRQSLTLSSHHNWLYGSAGTNGQSNNPLDGHPHVFWDESRFFITGGVKQGDILRLQKTDADTAGFYKIDLIDLEMARPPLSAPSTPYLSVKDYGAMGKGLGDDDTSAIQRCINDAALQNKIAWIPAGRYNISAKLVINGVTVQGAGMWYTEIIATGIGSISGSKPSFQLKGENPHVRDLFFDGDYNTSRGRDSYYAFSGPAHNWSVENVWITHTGTGFWISLSSNGLIRGNRVRFTYADGINLNRGTSSTVIENNHVRGTGDDGIAVLSEVNNPVSNGNTIRHNTVIAPWWGLNLDLAGGTGHNIQYNYLADNSLNAAFGINLPGSYPMFPVSNCTFSDNRIVRGGGNASHQQRGAIWIYPGSTSISGMTIKNNIIEKPIFSGIQLAGSKSQQISFMNNVIHDPSTYGIIVTPNVSGTGSFTDNSVSGSNSSYPQFQNNSKGYVVTTSGNSW